MDDSAPKLWQHSPDLPRVFLLDHASALENRILTDWVRCAETTPHTGTIIHLQSKAGMEKLRDLAGGQQDHYCVPLRVLWQPPAGQERKGLRRLLGSSPGLVRQHFIHWRSPQRARPLAAEGARLSELRSRLQERNPADSAASGAQAQFIYRQALLALDKAERNVRGARYKVPRLVAEEVLSKPRLAKALAEEAERSGRSLDAVLDEARACLKEMAPVHKPLALDLMAALGRYLYTQGFDPQIDFLPEDLARIHALGKRFPMAFLMTHKSHLDGFLLITKFYDLNMPPVHVFGGINMSFFGLGALGKRSGTIFIRRSMTGDNIYKAVFKQYIDYLAEKRFPLLWALEGTRSRVGKLMPPRFGLINYVVDSYARSASTDMILMPVSIAYDQVPEVGDYIAEHKGVSKRPESASWFMQYISGLRHPFGKIHVRFGEGLKLSEVLGQPGIERQPSALDIQKIAFRLSVDANAVTPILGTALITFVLSAVGRKALTRSELAVELAALVSLVRCLGLPTSGDIEFSDPETLNRTLAQLVGTGVLVRYDTGGEPLYAIDGAATMAAAYYRNTTIHFFVIGAIAELALVFVAQHMSEDPLASLHAEALHIRDILKFEFFFHDKSEFVQQLERDLDLRVTGWREAMNQNASAVFALLWRLNPLLAPATLRPFLESYMVLAEELSQCPPDTAIEPKTLLKQCVATGRQRALQRRIGSEESASKLYLENGLKLAQNRGLMETGEAATSAARMEFLAELRALARRTQFIAAAAENRRLGDEPTPDIGQLM